MRRILEVARREYLETVRTKTFLMGLLMTPVLIGAILYFGGRAERAGPGPQPPRRIALTDPTGQLLTGVRAQLDAHNASHPQRKILLEPAPAEADTSASALQAGKELVAQGRLDAYLVAEGNVVAGRGRFRAYTNATKAADMDFASTLEGLLNRAVVNERCRLHNLSPELLAELNRRVGLEQVDVGPAGQPERARGRHDRLVGLMVPFFFMFMMFMGVFGTGQHMLTSIIEEKGSRVIEVLLSALSPLELMAGKILGLGGIGLTVVGLWCAAAGATARWKGVSLDVPPELLAYFAIYYVLGFLLFSSILAGVGSVCNTLKECQALMMPLSLLMVLPMVAWFNLAQHPEGVLARVLSFVPPLTPMVMILRLSASSRLGTVEIVASIVVLAASVPAATWAAAKVFRTGVLMYGKPPRPAEVLRWIRQS